MSRYKCRMKLLNLTKFSAVLLCLCLSLGASAQQQSCTQILNDANTRYSEGSLAFIEEQPFNDCFSRADGYSEEEKIAARKLVTKVHIYEDRIPEAEESMVQLLHDDPEHPIDEALDPYEFVYLYSKFRTKPIFRVGVRLGVTYSSMSVIDEFGIENLNDDAEGSFSPEIGITAGAYIDYNFWKNFEASLGVSYAQRSVSYKNDLYETLNSQNNTREVFSPTNYSDVYGFIDMPLVIKYNINLSPKFIIYPYGGAIGHMLISATRTGSRTVVTPPSEDLTALGDNMISARENFNYSYTAGLGFKLRSNTDYFTLEFGATMGGNNFTDPDGRYQSNTLLFGLGQVDGNQSLNYLSVMFGYQRSIYNPKKLKQYRDK